MYSSKYIEIKSGSQNYYMMILKLSKMCLHLFAQLKCKIREIHLGHQVLKCSDIIGGTELIGKSEECNAKI